MHYNYILFSENRQKFYTGETQNLEERLERHNKGQVKSTKGGVPWKIIWSALTENRTTARKLEKKIKSRGIRRYVEDDNINMKEKLDG